MILILNLYVFLEFLDFCYGGWWRSYED